MKNLIDQDFDVLIIGSGPAGVSAAWPLVRAKKKILMLDVGFTKSNNVTKLYKNQDTSPKVRSPELSYVFRDFKKNTFSFIALQNINKDDELFHIYKSINWRKCFSNIKNL